MSTNKRIFYACQGVGIANMGEATFTNLSMVHGLQSVGMTTNFNLEQAFELGQLEIYENIEGTPDVEVTMEKVLDGYPLIYHLATTGVGAGSKLLANRSKQRCDLRLAILDEGENNIAQSSPEVEVYCSGMYVSSISYSLPTDGNSTESVTLVGNEKQWLTTGHGLGATDFDDFNGSDMPAASGNGGIQRREDVDLSVCILPVGIKGVNGSSAGNGWDTSAGEPRVHLQNISISTDFSREEVLELGRRNPYYRPANFPIEVTCEIEAITTSGDFIGAYELGDPDLYSNPVNSGNNTGEETIYIQTKAGYGFDLGTKNRVSSVSYGGGDAGGGNATTTYSYANFNDLDVQHSGASNSVTSKTFHFTNLGSNANS